MGDRGDLLRALTLALLVSQGGCIDFVEPDLPERGAPAVARLSVVVSDSGRLAVTGEVAPALDEDGFRRAVLDSTVLAADAAIEPLDTTGTALLYDDARAIDPGAVGGPVGIRGPGIASTRGTPEVRWPGIRRLDGDTVRVDADGDLRLHVAVGTNAAEASIRQWFLTLTGDTAVFRLSSDGTPPQIIDVPARWVPADAAHVTARLVYQQSGRIDAVADYVGLYLLDLRLHWTVRTDRP